MGAEEWDPAELLLYAVEYFDLYCLFQFRLENPDAGLADFYLEGALECVEDARAALLARSAQPS